MTVLEQYVIYDHPSDYPFGYVCRRFEISAAGPEPKEAWKADDLDEIRKAVPPHLVCIERFPDDDPVILEGVDLMFAPMMLIEAIHSCALEHPAPCRCDTCKAADGDRDALDRVFVKVYEEMEERERAARS